MTSVILLIASLIRFVTAERARSASEKAASVLASESNGSCQLLGYGVHLVAGAGSTVEIVKPLRLLRIFPQFVNAALVFCFGL